MLSFRLFTFRSLLFLGYRGDGLAFQDGGFAILQTGELDGDKAWCVSPITSKVIQSASRSKSGDLQCKII